MAVVYEAEDTELPRRIALKVLVDSDPQAKLRFVREAHAQAKVTHDNVVSIYRVGEDRGVSYIAMPVLNGQTLAQALNATPKPPLPAVVRIAAEVAEGLAAAHEKGLIHRDIKPANIWLEAPKWRVKILDFGLVRDPHANQQIDITMQGHVVGTPAFMSPEQAAGHEVDHRTDLWSLGVVLYQMTTGKRPFNDDNTVNLMTAIVSQEAPAPLNLAPELPPALSDLIRRLMSKSPSKRPPTAAAVSAELDAIGKALTGPPVVRASLPSALPEVSETNPWASLDATEADLSRVEPPPADASGDSYDGPPRRGRRAGRGRVRWPLVAGGALAAVLAVGLLAWALSGPGPKSKQTELTPEPLRPVPGGVSKPTRAPDPSKVAEPPKKEEPPDPPEVPAPEPDEERKAAEKLTRFANLRVQVGNEFRDVPTGGQLPQRPFVVAVIDFPNGRNRQFDKGFVSDTLLPAVAHLRGLQAVTDGWALPLTADHLRQMAGMPLASTLRVLQMSVVLTPEALPELRRLPALTEVAVVPPKPTDELFIGLAGLTNLRHLWFNQLGLQDALTGKGWAAVAGMRLELFGMWSCQGAANALRAFAARPGPLPTMQFMFSDLTDKALSDHLKPDTDLRAFEVGGGDVSNAGLAALAAVKSLRVLALTRTKVTGAQVGEVAARRPDLRIAWNGKVFEPKK
jgi:serine/threonine protein kinase